MWRNLHDKIFLPNAFVARERKRKMLAVHSQKFSILPQERLSRLKAPGTLLG